MILDIPDDVFVKVHPYPKKAYLGRTATRFTLFKQDMAVRDSIYFWTNEFQKGKGLSPLDVTRKMEKLLNVVDRLK